MRLPIEIETREDRLAFDLFDATTLAVGVSHALPGGAILTFRGLGERRDPADPFTVRLEIGLENGSIPGAVTWLCGRLRGRATSIRVGGIGVAVDPVTVEQAFTRAIS